MCPKGDDPLTINQNDYSFQLRATGTSALSGVLGVVFQGDYNYLDLDSPSGSDCEVAFERSGKFSDVTCSLSIISSSDLLYNISVVSWPTDPQENNVFAHDGNPSLTAFHCDVVRADGGVSCEFLESNRNLKG